MNSRIRVGIAGLGSIGKTHVRALRQLTDKVDLVSATYRGVRDQLPDECGDLELVGSVDELVADDRIDLIVVCTPSGVHYDHAIAALEHDKAVVVEKPLATTVDGSRAIVELARRKNIFGSVIAQRRLEPQHVALKRILDDGSAGRVLLCEAFVHWYRDDAYYRAAAWRAEDPSGGALMNQGLHNADLMNWLAGPAISVAAHTGRLRHDELDAEDTVTASLRFESGAQGVLVASTAIEPGEAARLVVYTTKGVVDLVHTDIARWDIPGVPKPSYESAALSGATDPAAIGVAGHLEQWRDILDAYVKGRRPEVTLEDGHATVAMIDAIYQSARTGRAMNVSG